MQITAFKANFFSFVRRINTLGCKDYENTFAPMESDGMLRFGFKALTYRKFFHNLHTLVCEFFAQTIAFNAVICMICHFFLDNGVMTTLKRRILLFVFTILCFRKSILRVDLK